MEQPVRPPPHEQEEAVDAGPCDAPLVASARNGDRAAWAQLYRRYAPVVHGVLLARVGVRRADADDLTHDVFLQAMRHLGDIREGAAVGGWLIAIARNAAISLSRRPRPGSIAEFDRAARPNEPRGEESEQAERVLAVIRSLPEAYRETLVLRLVEGLTGPALASRMGMTHGSVRVNLHRGMQLLKERLGIDAESTRAGDET
jgi:RNA polymerase sigma-70 factor, ECF subfamily